MKLFTTDLLVRKVVQEKYPNEAVLTQFPYSAENAKFINTRFVLNKKAMEMLGLQNETAKANKITWGRSITGEPMLAAITGVDKAKESDITAENTFSSLRFLKFLEKTFEIDATNENNYNLEITDDEGIKVATLKLREENNTTEDIEPILDAEVDKILDAEELVPTNNEDQAVASTIDSTTPEQIFF